jgi:hypothetical protein
VSVRTPFNIIRKNVFYYNDGSGLDISTYDSTYDARFNHVYNNTFFHNGFTLLSGVETWKQNGMLVAKHGNSAPATNISIVNNLFYDNKIDAIRFYYTIRDSQDIRNNWEHAGDPFFTDIVSKFDPWNTNLPDFHLKKESPCIDKGTFITFITSPTGSGTQFTVKDAMFFTNGWGIIEPDTIQLKEDFKRVSISEINYATSQITVSSPLSWTQGQGVNLAYNQDAPDIGAFEYYGTSVKIKLTKNKNMFDINKIELSFENTTLNMIVNLFSETNLLIRIFDVRGRIILSLKYHLKKGNNLD